MENQTVNNTEEVVESKQEVVESKPGKCKHNTEVYSRVCGFFRPVQQWNKGKKEEFKERVEFSVDQSALAGSSSVVPVSQDEEIAA